MVGFISVNTSIKLVSLEVIFSCYFFFFQNRNRVVSTSTTKLWEVPEMTRQTLVNNATVSKNKQENKTPSEDYVRKCK